MAGVAPGEIIKRRSVALSREIPGLPSNATQVLYRTTDQFGAPSATVTTIIEPARPLSGRPVISYHTFYDALGAQCDPSYTLRGGGGNSVLGTAALGVISAWTNAGYTVSVPDYEGERLRWTMGLESGRAALDGLRATRNALRLPAATEMAMMGYSGGSIPTGFAADLAPDYAPELNLVGAAAGGVLVDPAHNLTYIDGSWQWGGLIPALMVVYDETYGLDLSRYLTPRGVEVTGAVRDQCIGKITEDYPGMTQQQLLTVPSLLDVPGVPAAIDQNIMGTSGTPRIPMSLGNGHSDAIGDGVMVYRDVVDLARSYCERGVPTTFRGYPGLDHEEAFAPWQADAMAFLAGRFGGGPAGGCSGGLSP